VATPSYASRESALAALDAADSARTHAKLDQALQAATETINGACLRGGTAHPHFYPVLATRYFPWPGYDHTDSRRLYLNGDELISVVSIVAGGNTWTAADYSLEPDDGPPYDEIVINPSGVNAFESTSTEPPERAIAITGLFGYRNDETPAGALEDAVNDSATTFTVTDGSLVGIGDLIRCDSERMVVTGRALVDSTQNTTGALTASKADSTVGVASGAGFHVGEEIVIDAERMLITDIAGNNLIVKRAWVGTTLATHANPSDVYVSRSLTVARGSCGTTAAAHLDAAALVRWVPPSLISQWCEALAVARFEQGSAAYAATVGTGESSRNEAGGGMATLEADAMARYARYRYTAV
jgi:hypothetical protein